MTMVKRVELCGLFVTKGQCLSDIVEANPHLVREDIQNELDNKVTTGEVEVYTYKGQLFYLKRG